MTGKPARRILHLDLDAFYASVEVLDDPSLRGKPVIVGGSERRGVVSAASYEARKFGVRSAMPVSRAKRICPHGVFLPVRMERYKEVSDRVFEIFHRFTPFVEPLSIDEAFLDVTGSERLFGSAEEIAERIRQAVRAETGLTVSAGVASSKLVAKIASDLGKPDGLVAVPPGTEKEFLEPLPADRLWGVGKVTREALREMGVHTIGDIARVSPDTLKRRFGEHGSHLHLLANAIDDREVETEEETKSIGREETFGEDLTKAEEIRRELLSLATRVAARARRHGFKGRTVVLKVRYGDFTLISRERTLPYATDDGGEIYRCVLSLLPKTEAGTRPVRLLGIYLTGFVTGERAEEWRQLSLFGGAASPGTPAGETKAPDPSRMSRLNETMDRIRKKYGEKGIRPGTLAEE